MDEYTADAFANRDEPVPLLTVTVDDDNASSSETEQQTNRKRDRLRKTLSESNSRIKAIAQDYGSEQAQRLGSSSGLSLQDRLFTKLLQQVVPGDDLDDGADGVPVDRRSSQYVQRPSFSLPVMTSNFRRFNARIGIVFVFQNRMIRLFTWKKTTHTLSFLAVYWFVCLDPYLLVVLPLAVLLLFIMIPAFIARHPPPPPSISTSSTTPYYSYEGPAIAPPKTIKPAAETSKDFFRNMRDLQNSMADFAGVHDQLVKTIAPPTNFSNEILSSTIFLYLTFLTTSLFIIAHLIPWRLIFLLGGTILTISGHPTIQSWLLEQKARARTTATQADLDYKSPTTQTKPHYYSTTILGLTITLPFPTSVPISPAALKSLFWRLSDITLDSAPEAREVEIFELQHRPLHSAAEWQPHLFTPQPYDPLSPARISGDRPHGTRFFEDVQPPQGWAWQGPKWELDLEPREWVAERLVTGVEFDVIDDDNDGTPTTATSSATRSRRGEFGGWVWDLPPSVRSEGFEDDEMWLAYGEEYSGGSGGKKRDLKEKLKREAQVGRDWEEGRWAGRTGEWRRRRWVRVVRRVGMDGIGKDGKGENGGG